MTYLGRLKGLSADDAKSRARDYLAKLDLSEHEDSKVEALSKGMQQKVQFVTTVVHKPKLLIFDEPFSGFDPINANLLKREILSLRDEGATIIFSTHNMGSVEELCDHIALINKSKKIVDGPTSQIRERFKQNIFEIKYNGKFADVEKALGLKMKILEHSESEKENQLTIQYLNRDSNNQLIQTLLPVAEIVSFEEIIPSMNDVFITAVEESNKI